MSAVGSIVKNELVSNLNIAKETMKELANIIEELGLEEYATRAVNSTSTRNRMSTLQPQSASAPIINFNSELIRIDGDVNEDMLPLLKDMIEEAKTELVDEIVRNIQ